MEKSKKESAVYQILVNQSLMMSDIYRNTKDEKYKSVLKDNLEISLQLIEEIKYHGL